MPSDRSLPLQIRLRDGVLVPLDAYLVARDLEQRGCRLHVDGDDLLIVGPPDRITEDDRRALRLYRSSIKQIVERA